MLGRLECYVEMLVGQGLGLPVRTSERYLSMYGHLCVQIDFSPTADDRKERTRVLYERNDGATVREALCGGGWERVGASASRRQGMVADIGIPRGQEGPWAMAGVGRICLGETQRPSRRVCAYDDSSGRCSLKRRFSPGHGFRRRRLSEVALTVLSAKPR
ncbi:hypothetical protein FA95DRAFT_947778 [Auriscalpium vulgare]|uniref:Uncharacterized protein n=1 Tax=Auriscalpium vulgare TaxID=40419 RepID=A0ACB8RYQ8_9AGAM|nr:hypothetical protein FA95DRAFT_947778 [Auriscalpium vulgare]